MLARSFRREEDQDRVVAIWEENRHLFGNDSLPGRVGALGDVVIEEDGKLIAYGQLQLFSIAHMFLDQNISVRKRRKAMGLMLEAALDVAKAFDIQKIYTFTHDPEYARLVEKHFGFELRGSLGEMLVREV